MASPPRERIVNLRVSEQEYASIRRNAKRAGLSVSTYMRSRALDGDAAEIAAHASAFARVQETSPYLDAAQAALDDARRMLGGQRRK